MDSLFTFLSYGSINTCLYLNTLLFYLSFSYIHSFLSSCQSLHYVVSIYNLFNLIECFFNHWQFRHFNTFISTFNWFSKANSFFKWDRWNRTALHGNLEYDRFCKFINIDRFTCTNILYQQVAPTWMKQMTSAAPDFSELLKHIHDIIKANKRFYMVK